MMRNFELYNETLLIGKLFLNSLINDTIYLNIYILRERALCTKGTFRKRRSIFLTGSVRETLMEPSLWE